MNNTNLHEIHAATATEENCLLCRNAQDEAVRHEMDREIAAVMRAGVMFLQAGAEVYRTEATITQMGESMPGIDKCICYVTVTGIIVSLVRKDRTVTRIARVDSTSRNLTVVNAIADLASENEKEHCDAAIIMQKLDDIEKLPCYSDWMVILFGALGTVGFAYFFNGTWQDCCAVFGVGLLIGCMVRLLEKLNMNLVFVNGVSAFAAGLLCQYLSTLSPDISQSVLIISSIMLLVPGLTLTNAIRDTVMGEYLSGMVRGLEAVIIAASIALGMALALYVW